YVFSPFILNMGYMLAFAAGSFIYIATTDLIPGLRKERNLTISIVQIILLLGGITFMWVIKTI
ncbi:ZIP family metal transporter, partial [Candidatus Bathyarchaeota archaeon]|nr:ZIP family metal transporter [Candidatus Bathyarchaeota archaeon]